MSGCKSNERAYPAEEMTFGCESDLTNASATAALTNKNEYDLLMLKQRPQADLIPLDVEHFNVSGLPYRISVREVVQRHEVNAQPQLHDQPCTRRMAPALPT
jgi:hypothetical protein